MTKVLDVYLHDNLVGQLVQDKHGQIAFSYNENWLSNHAAIPLSQSLPLQSGIFRQKQCRAYFAGILPEEEQRNIIAHNLGISARNDFAMLARIGGECAGAVTFIPAGERLKDHLGAYKQLTDRELANIIRELPERPLLAGEDGIRLSLAGAQNKVAVCIEEGKTLIPLDDALSTHIIKPAHQRFKDLVYNEYTCLKLAKMVGLPAANVEIASVEGLEFLVIERFDRKTNNSGKRVRLHQEDFCQALGIVSEMKYEIEGGPTLEACFNLVRSVSSNPGKDLQYLLDAVIFNYLIGNNEAHGKNFSLLYFDSNDIRFAPLYDILSTAYYPELNKKMAMRIGREYIDKKIRPSHFEKLAEDATLAKPLVKERVKQLTNEVLINLDKLTLGNPTACEIKSMIKARCERTLSLFI